MRRVSALLFCHLIRRLVCDSTTEGSTTPSCPRLCGIHRYCIVISSVFRHATSDLETARRVAYESAEERHRAMLLDKVCQYYGQIILLVVLC